MLSFSLVVPANSFASPFSKSDLNDEIIFNLKHTSIITNKEEKIEFEYSWALPAATLEAQGSYPVFLTLRRYVEDASFLDIDRGLSPLKTKDTLNSFQKTRFLRAIESYKKGHGYLEWQRGPFLFRQYYMAPGELLTLSGQHLSDKKQTKTYYKQERYSDPQETSIEEVYSDSRYQLEYWHDQGEWVVELPYEEGGKEKRYAERFKAVKRIKKSFKPLHAYERGEEGELVYTQPRQFAYPPYRLELERREVEEFLDTQPQLTKAFLLNALLLSGGIVDSLRSSSFVSSTSSTTTGNSFNISDWIFYPSSSWIPYASLASVLIPSQPHFMGPKLMPFAISILSLFETTDAVGWNVPVTPSPYPKPKRTPIQFSKMITTAATQSSTLPTWETYLKKYEFGNIVNANSNFLIDMFNFIELYDNDSLQEDDQELQKIADKFNSRKQEFKAYIRNIKNSEVYQEKFTKSSSPLEDNLAFFEMDIEKALAVLKNGYHKVNYDPYHIFYQEWSIPVFIRSYDLLFSQACSDNNIILREISSLTNKYVTEVNLEKRDIIVKRYIYYIEEYKYLLNYVLKYFDSNKINILFFITRNWEMLNPIDDYMLNEKIIDYNNINCKLLIFERIPEELTNNNTHEEL